MALGCNVGDPPFLLESAFLVATPPADERPFALLGWTSTRWHEQTSISLTEQVPSDAVGVFVMFSEVINLPSLREGVRWEGAEVEIETQRWQPESGYVLLVDSLPTGSDQELVFDQSILGQRGRPLQDEIVLRFDVSEQPCRALDHCRPVLTDLR